jgi:hypothetical protein
MNNEDRHDWVMDYVRNHPGCIMEQMICDCKVISRKTLFRVKSELQYEDKIREDKRDGRRSSPLYVNRENPLVRVPAELERFENQYSVLLVAANTKISHILTSGINDKEISDIIYNCLSLLTEISNYYIYQAFVVWSKELNDPVLINKLYDIIFKKLTKLGAITAKKFRALTESSVCNFDYTRMLLGNRMDRSLELWEFDKAGLKILASPIIKYLE